MKTGPNIAEKVLFLIAVGLICTGIVFIFWPAAPIAAGVLLLADLNIDRT